MIGTRFGAQQILRQIAGGLASKVFLASDGSAVCAVKVFAPTFESHADREYRFGRDLDHPRVNRIDQRLELAGHAAVRMPFVPGVQLSHWLPAHGDRSAVFVVAFDVLDALEHLHGHGVVHRDVKPENLLVGRDDRAVLIDFDLAAFVGERVGERGWAGTPAYLSPSRARGEPAQPHDDLYSAAVVLYRGLTGRLPFSGSPEEVLTAHLSERPWPPSAFDASLEPLDDWMSRALAKRRGDGFASAAEMRSALEAVAPRLVDGASWKGRG